MAERQRIHRDRCECECDIALQFDRIFVRLNELAARLERVCAVQTPSDCVQHRWASESSYGETVDGYYYEYDCSRCVRCGCRDERRRRSKKSKGDYYESSAWIPIDRVLHELDDDEDEKDINEL